MLLLLSWTSTTVHAQGYYFNVTGAKHRAEFYSAVGEYIVIDGDKQRVYVSDASKHTLSFSFDELAQVVSQNPQLANGLTGTQFKSRLLAAVTDPADTVTFSGFKYPTLGLDSSSSGGGGGFQTNAISPIHGAESLTLLDSNCFPNCDGPSPTTDCMGGFCLPSHDLNGRFIYMTDGGSSNRTMSSRQQRCRAAHYDQWIASHGAACHARTMALLGLGSSAIFGGLGCIVAAATGETGVGLAAAYAACGAMASGLVINADQYTVADRDCSRAYPGPGDMCM